MKIIYASQALLPDEWASDVYVGLAEDGRIAFVQRADESQDQHQQPIDSRVGMLLPAPANLHSHAFQRAQAAGRQSGRIEAGQWADLLALDTQHPDLEGKTGDTLLDSFIFAGDDRMVREVWSVGRHQVTAGRHREREAIVQRYRKVMKSAHHAC